jgi:hypothetical protein
LLHLAYDGSSPGSQSALDVLYNLYLNNSNALGKVLMLSLEIPIPSQAELPKLYAALQHTQQEVGLLGFYHQEKDTPVGRHYQLGWQKDQQLLLPC